MTPTLGTGRSRVAMVNAGIDTLTGETDTLRDLEAGQSSTVAFDDLFIPLDDSRASEMALAWAETLAKAFRSRAFVAHVVEAPTLREAFLSRNDVEARRLKEGAVLVQTAVKRMRANARSCRGEVARGWTVPTLLRLHAQRPSRLVVAGSKGSGPVSRFLLGSVADGLKSQAPSSIFLAKNAPPLRRLIVATDGSFESRLAALAGLELAERLRATVRVLHVLSYGDRDRPAEGDPLARDLPAGVISPWRKVRASFEVRVGRPAAEIVEAARRTAADLIVMGARGLSGLRTIVPGGVSSRVAHTAPCSVLMVKGGDLS